MTSRDLARHDCIGLNAESDAEPWPFRAAGGANNRVRSVRVRTRLSVNHQSAVIDAVLRGQGIVCAKSYQVADHLVSGRLSRVLAAFEPPAVPVHIVFPADRGERRVIRTFVEHLAAALRKEFLRIEASIPSA